MARPLATIIGAGPGIGLSVARRFAREGFDLALVCRPFEEGPVFRAELEALGSKALVIPADLAQRGTLEPALAAIERDMGLPEVLVYNASRGARGPVAELDPEDLVEDFRVCAALALACVQWVLPAMRGRGRGTLLFTGGGLALEPKAGEASPSAGKAALRSLALCLAQELEPEGLHAATVTVAGFVQEDSAFNGDFIAEAFWELHAEPKEAWRSEVVLSR